MGKKRQSVCIDRSTRNPAGQSSVSRFYGAVVNCCCGLSVERLSAAVLRFIRGIDRVSSSFPRNLLIRSRQNPLATPALRSGQIHCDFRRGLGVDLNIAEGSHYCRVGEIIMNINDQTLAICRRFLLKAGYAMGI